MVNAKITISALVYEWKTKADQGLNNCTFKSNALWFLQKWCCCFHLPIIIFPLQMEAAPALAPPHFTNILRTRREGPYWWHHSHNDTSVLHPENNGETQQASVCLKGLKRRGSAHPLETLQKRPDTHTPNNKNKHLWLLCECPPGSLSISSPVSNVSSLWLQSNHCWRCDGFINSKKSMKHITANIV